MIETSQARSGRKYVYRGDPLTEPPPAELVTILARHQDRRDALLPVLDEVQRHYGYLPARALGQIAAALRLPLSRVYGVATFYHLFSLTPPGQYLVRVCRGTACHVNGSAALLAALAERLGIGEEETTADGRFTLQTVACTGACSLAPVLVVNDRSYGRMSPAQVIAVLDELHDGEPVGRERQ
jgi:NADH-quinone oxidoreductase subunit E